MLSLILWHLCNTLLVVLHSILNNKGLLSVELLTFIFISIKIGCQCAGAGLPQRENLNEIMEGVGGVPHSDTMAVLPFMPIFETSGDTFNIPLLWKCKTKFNKILAGVWESCYIQTWETCQGRSKRSWCFLHHSLCGLLWQNWYEKHDIWDPTTRGNFSWKLLILKKTIINTKINPNSSAYRKQTQMREWVNILLLSTCLLPIGNRECEYLYSFGIRDSKLDCQKNIIKVFLFWSPIHWQDVLNFSLVDPD